jgi:ribonucleotide monophosphatase NagD (HAD superfamily)
MYTASYITAQYVKKNIIDVAVASGKADPSVYLVGNEGFKKELENHGIRVINDPDDSSEQMTSMTPERFAEEPIDKSVVAVIVGADFNFNF